MFMFVLNYTMYKFKMCSIKVFGRNPCKWWTNNIFTRKVTVELIDYKTPLKAGTQPPISSASDEGENKQDKLNKQNRMAWGWFTKLQDNYKYFCINGTVLANDFIVEKFRPNAMKMKRKALKHKASIQTKMARITKMKKRRKKNVCANRKVYGNSGQMYAVFVCTLLSFSLSVGLNWKCSAISSFVNHQDEVRHLNIYKERMRYEMIRYLDGFSNVKDDKQCAQSVFKSHRIFDKCHNKNNEWMNAELSVCVPIALLCTPS